MQKVLHRMIDRHYYVLFFFIPVLLMTACADNSGPTEDVLPQTGSIEFTIELADDPYGTDGIIVPRAISDECGIADQNQVSGVAATVYSSPVVSGSWACSSGSGTIQNVTPGNNLRIVVIAYNHSSFGGLTLYSGETRVNVFAGQTSRPTIVAEVFRVNKIYPAQDAVDIDPVNINFQWESASGANGYVVELWDRQDGNDPDRVVIFSETTTNTSFTYDGTLDENTTYYWGVFPVDIAGDSAYDTVWGFTTGSAGPVGDDSFEENDTIGTAFDLSTWDGMYLSNYFSGGGIAVNGDDDFYRITVPYTNATIEVTCLFTHADGDIDMELLDESGSIVDNSVSANDNESITINHSGSAGATYYIRVWRFGGGDPNQYDLIWYARPDATMDVNLTQYNYDWGDPDLNVYFRTSDQSGNPSSTFNWGDTVKIRFAVTNNGSEDIDGTGVWVRVYLSPNDTISYLDYELEDRVLTYNLQGGWYIYQQEGFEWEITLPTMGERPANWPDTGDFYIGIIIDPDNLIIETDEYDNSNQGETWDYTGVYITP